MSIRKKIITSSLYLLTLLSFYKISYSAEALKAGDHKGGKNNVKKPKEENPKEENPKKGKDPNGEKPTGENPKDGNGNELEFLSKGPEFQDVKEEEKVKTDLTTEEEKLIEEFRKNLNKDIGKSFTENKKKIEDINKKKDDEKTKITNIEENVKIVDTQNEIQKKSYC